MRIHPARKLPNFREVNLEHRVYALQIELQIPMHQRVAKARERAELLRQFGRENPEPPQFVDRRGVIWVSLPALAAKCVAMSSTNWTQS
jgi:hypothetical protein